MKRLVCLVIAILGILLISQGNDTIDSNSHEDISAKPLKPPTEIPEELRSSFTLDNTIPIEKYYVDDTSSDGDGHTHFKFSSDILDVYLSGSYRTHDKIRQLHEKTGYLTIDKVDLLLPYFPKEQWIYLATLVHLKFTSHEEFENRKLVGLVIGSMEPWLEMWLLHLGFFRVVTSEYNDLTFDHPKLRTERGGCRDLATRKEYQNYFDVIISLSSFDHDGLGRYGDPIDPYGDTKSMIAIKSLIKPDGKFFLTVPIGPDVLVWNLHRRYGALRLPMLLSGWNIIGKVGWIENMLTNPRDFRKTYEPVLILQSNLTQVKDISDNVFPSNEL